LCVHCCTDWSAQTQEPKDCGDESDHQKESIYRGELHYGQIFLNHENNAIITLKTFRGL